MILDKSDLLRAVGLLISVFGIIGCSGGSAPLPVEGGQGNRAFVIDYNGEPASDGMPKPWVIKVHAGTPQIEILASPQQNNEKVVRLRCVDSSFSLNNPDLNIDVKQFSGLSWNWLAEQLPTSAAVNPEGKKEQVLQLYFLFEGKKVVSYHWDTARPKGTSYDDSIPFLVKVKVIVVESGSENLRKWKRVARDIYTDFKNLFGEEPGPLKAIRLQANSQYTKSTCSGYVSKLTFEREGTMEQEQKQQ
jgi:hypothetical protein